MKVTGLRELQRDFRKMDKEAAKGLRADLKESGEIVRLDARTDFQHVSPRAAAGFRTVVRQRGVSVEQRKGRTTGKRPDFGRHQLRYLQASLESKSEEVMKRFERTIDRLATRNGF